MSPNRAAILLALCLSACGGGQDVRPAAAPAGAYVDDPTLEQGIGNTFRQRLYRLAVMTQTGDDAADVGQPLPTGLVDDARCRPQTAGSERRMRPWRCVVRWETVEGHRRTTRYVVQTTPGGCYYAQASPPLPQVLDATVHAPAEHPLGNLTGAVRGC